MISLKDIGLEPKINVTSVQVAEGIEAEVRSYLTMDEKVRLLEYVLTMSIDETTGCFSPVRLETYFILGAMKFYAGIDTEDISSSEAYDILETNGITKMILNAIPSDELEFMQTLIKDSVASSQEYNTSAAGIIQNMSNDASGLNDQITSILNSVKNREGLELLEDIKKVGGTD